MSNCLTMIRYLTTLAILFLSLAPAASADFSSPEATLATYKEALRLGSFEDSDRCYTAEFRRFQQSDEEYGKHRHPRQLEQAFRSLENRKFEVEQVGPARAILRWKPADPALNPFYLVKEGAEWKIDGLFMYRNIIYGPSGWQWRNGAAAEENWKRGR